MDKIEQIPEPVLDGYGLATYETTGKALLALPASLFPPFETDQNLETLIAKYIF